MITIKSVAKSSIAEQLGVRAGDKVLTINDHPLHDFLDYQFFQSDERLDVRIQIGQRRRRFHIEKEYDEDLGLDFADPPLKTCTNNCIFCFIKQNPPGLRRSIYLCDEDYRYSFLHGNYITLSSVSTADLERIVTQRLFPLYISVHTTDPKVRKKIFRYKKDDRLRAKLDFLNRHRIRLHTQIVLLPGINDGAILERTLKDLYRFKASIKTVAIVPVGLTKYRRNLPPLQSVDRDLAGKIVDRTSEWDCLYPTPEGNPFIFLADEFYLLAGQPFPPNEHYGTYDQIENGVGLSRRFITDFEEQRQEFPSELKAPRRVLWITGALAAPVLQEHVLPELNAISNLSVDLCPVRNDFFGSSVTVSGLLTGRDILAQLHKDTSYDELFLPPRCINSDGLMLDDRPPQEIAKHYNIPVTVFDGDFRKVVR